MIPESPHHNLALALLAIGKSLLWILLGPTCGRSGKVIYTFLPLRCVMVGGAHLSSCGWRGLTGNEELRGGMHFGGRTGGLG
jgi:hypothetical protein